MQPMNSTDTPAASSPAPSSDPAGAEALRQRAAAAHLPPVTDIVTDGTRHTRYHIDLIISNLLYGANFSYFISITRYFLDFRSLFMLQVAVSALFFIPSALFSPRYRLSARDFGTLVIVTLLVIYGGMFLLLWGAQYTNPIGASTIATLGPAFTLVTAWALYRERISRVKLLGIMLSLFGACILIFDEGPVLTRGSAGYGNLLVLGSVVCVAANTVIIKPVLKRLGTAVVMGWYYIIGLALTLPFFWEYLAYAPYGQLPVNAWAEILYILILGTVLPSYLLYRGTEKLTSIHTALYRYIQPVVATLVALSRHQERLDRNHIIAAAFIFTGIILVVTAYRSVVRRLRRVFEARG